MGLVVLLTKRPVATAGNRGNRKSLTSMTKLTGISWCITRYCGRRVVPQYGHVTMLLPEGTSIVLRQIGHVPLRIVEHAGRIPVMSTPSSS